MRLFHKLLIAVLGILFIVAVTLFLKKRHGSEVKSAELANLSNDYDSLKVIVSQLQYNYGFEIAKQKCMTCHRFHLATDNILAGVVDRRGEDYLRLYLSKQDSLVSARDLTAMQLKNTFGNLANSHNFKLTDEEFDALIEFMRR